jgi:hypothetical protein
MVKDTTNPNHDIRTPGQILDLLLLEIRHQPVKYCTILLSLPQEIISGQELITYWFLLHRVLSIIGQLIFLVRSNRF